MERIWKRGKDIVNPCWCNHDSEIRENVSWDNCQREFINVLFENFKQQPRCTIVKENANCFDVGAAASKLVLILTANYQMIKKNWLRLFLYFLKLRSWLLLLKRQEKRGLGIFSSQIEKSTSCNKSPGWSIFQCNADEMERKSTEAIAELDLSFQQVSIAEESVVDHQV